MDSNISTFTCLVVDDDPDDQMMIKDALGVLNYNLKIYSLYNGKELIKWLDGNSLPDLITMDLNMPVLDGLSTLRKLKSHAVYRHIPVFMLSTSFCEDDKLSAKKIGAEDFYTKPYTFDSLKAIVSDVCSRALTFMQSRRKAG